MRILLLTLYSEEFRPLHAVTGPSKESYCTRWGLQYTPIQTRPDAWERLSLWRQHLEACDWLFFMGTDTAITNPAIDIHSFCFEDADFIFSIDRNGLQSDVFLLRNTPACRSLLENALTRWNQTPLPYNEQSALNIELSESKNHGEYSQKAGNLTAESNPPGESVRNRLQIVLSASGVRCRVVPCRTFNAYPHEFYHGETGPDSEGWHPRDFIAHMPGTSLHQRMEFFMRPNP